MPNMKEIRLKKQISKEELAYKAGVTVRYIDFLEAGVRKPSLSVAFAIAKVLGSKVEDIFLPTKCTKCT